jgi:hypothetical protein
LGRDKAIHDGARKKPDPRDITTARFLEQANFKMKKKKT